MRKLLLLLVFVPVAVHREADRPPRDIVPPPKVCRVLVTAYTSEVAQTDDTPFTTASQTPVREGIVAARWLPFGAQVRLRGHFADEVFTVEDRMARKNHCKMDIWMGREADAAAWGIQEVEVEIVRPLDAVCPPLPKTVRHRCPDPAAS